MSAISAHLRKILPGLQGFSAESLKKMRLFYEGWMMLENGSSVSDGDNSVIAITETDDIDIYHAMVIPNTADFPAAEFLAVPFTHHSRILSKTKTLPDIEELKKLLLLLFKKMRSVIVFGSSDS